MRRTRRAFSVVLAVCALAVVGGPSIGTGPAAAQDATPSVAEGDAVDPAECQVDPRPVDEVLALWFGDDTGTPALATPEPPPAPTAAPIPLGDPVDTATAAAVTATVREFIACANAGDFPRTLALFSDDLAAQFGPEEGATADDVRPFLTAAPGPVPADQRTRLLAVTDVSEMADGRVGALVVSDGSKEQIGPVTQLLLFVEGRDRWLVDAVADFTAAG